MEAVTLAGDYSISATDLVRIGVLLNKFIIDYERLYYRYEKRRLPACKPTIHALTHVEECVEWLGEFFQSKTVKDGQRQSGYSEHLTNVSRPDVVIRSMDNGKNVRYLDDQS